MALHTLARHDIELEETEAMSDAQLLALPNLGKKSLRYIRTLAELERANAKVDQLRAELKELEGYPVPL